MTARLIDAGGNVLWESPAPVDIGDRLTALTGLTDDVIASLGIETTAREHHRMHPRRPPQPAAFDAFLRGWFAFRRNAPESLAMAVSELERALALDPTFARAHAALAAVHWRAWRRRWHWHLGMTWHAARLVTLAHLDAALGTSAPSRLAYRTAASARLVRAQLLNFRPEDEAAAADRYALALAGKGGGRAKRSDACAAPRPLRVAAMVLDPGHGAGFSTATTGAAAADFERELADDPAASPIALAVAYSHLGREREARALIADFKTAWREVMAGARRRARPPSRRAMPRPTWRWPRSTCSREGRRPREAL